MATATARLEARVPEQQKRLFERAAELRGQSLTDFIVTTAQAEAVRTLEEHNVMKLTIEEQQRFVAALMNPPAPNAALLKAANRYRKMIAR
jgi:uncharacterized protein (DUF1778 family)